MRVENDKSLSQKSKKVPSKTTDLKKKPEDKLTTTAKEIKTKKKPRKERAKNKMQIESETFLRVIRNGGVITNSCNDYKIGASSVFNLLAGNYSLRKAHGRYETKFLHSNIGNLGEAFFLKNNRGSIYKIGSTAYYPGFPFIVAKCDFITDKGKIKLIEVKTSTTNNLDCLSNRDLLQIWITMDCNFLDTCELHKYHIEPYDFKKHGEIAGLVPGDNVKPKQRKRKRKKIVLTNEILKKRKKKTLPFSSNLEPDEITNYRTKLRKRAKYSDHQSTNLIKKQDLKYVVLKHKIIHITKSKPFLKNTKMAKIFVNEYLNFLKVLFTVNGMNLTTRKAMALKKDLMGEIEKIKITEHKSYVSKQKKKLAINQQEVLKSFTYKPCLFLGGYLNCYGMLNPESVKPERSKIYNLQKKNEFNSEAIVGIKMQRLKSLEKFTENIFPCKNMILTTKKINLDDYMDVIMNAITNENKTKPSNLTIMNILIEIYYKTVREINEKYGFKFGMPNMDEYKIMFATSKEAIMKKYADAKNLDVNEFKIYIRKTVSNL